MGRRKALAIAGAISISAMTAALAIGANFGLFGLTGGSGTQVGNFAAEAPDVAAPASAVLDAPSAPASEPAPEIVVVGLAPAASLFAEPTEPPPVITAADPEPEPAPAVSNDDADDDDNSGHGRGRNRGPGGGGDDDNDRDEDHDDDDD